MRLWADCLFVCLFCHFVEQFSDKNHKVLTMLLFALSLDIEKPVIHDAPVHLAFYGNHNRPVNWTEPWATDNSGFQTLTSSHIPGVSRFSKGETTDVTYTATDPSGNNATIMFSVLIQSMKYMIFCISRKFSYALFMLVYAQKRCFKTEECVFFFFFFF